MTGLILAGRRPCQGYTLIELMVSAMILAIGLTAVMRTFTAGVGAVARNERRTIAVSLAQQRLAEVQGLAELTDGRESGDVEEPWGQFRWQTTIESIDDLTTHKRVLVSILWDEGEAVDDVTLESIVRIPPEEEEE